ncbi:MAG TPA: class I SAM-dependent methyltransferase [Ilumatobacteraceae bacterium]
MRSTTDGAAAPSQTAQRVAALRLTFARLGHAGGDPAADDRLAAAVASFGAIAPAAMPASEYALQLREHLARRTLFFDQFVVDALADGTTQIVIVGAGYDGRAMRYASPGATFYEIDHPDTQAHKLQLLDELDLATAPSIERVAVDLVSGSAAAALATTSHDPSRPSAVMCEGLAVYLAAVDLDRLLRDLRGCCRDGSRLAVSFPGGGASSDPSRTWRTPLAEHVAALGEPMLAKIGPDQFGAVLSAAGWTIDTTASVAPNLFVAV